MKNRRCSVAKMRCGFAIIRKLFAGLLPVALLGMSPPVRADAVANFTDGVSTSLVDAYTGTAGAGWLAGWKATASNSVFSNSVLSSVPLGGGGNYLSASLNYNGSANTGNGAVGRKFDPAVVSSSAPYAISFKVRPDSAFLSGSDRLLIFGDVSTGYVFSTGSGNTFVISGDYNNGSPVWNVLDGNRANGGTTVSTGMAMTPGTVYSFVVKVDPAARSWTVSIDNGATQYQSGTLGFRTGPSADGGNTVYFGAVVRNTTGIVNYSVDSLAVKPATEAAPSGFPYQIQANFTPGNMATHVDGYLGQAGAGWLDAWRTMVSSGTFSNTVVATSPLKASGNYLDVNFSITGTTATSGIGTTGRKFDTRIVNDTLPHTISFDLRPDTTLLNGSDKVLVFGDIGTNYAFSTGATNTFVIMGQLSGSTSTWWVQNGNKAGGGTSVNTGMAMTAGVVYGFAINVDPASRSWTVTIDNGTTQYQSGTLGFRASPSPEAGNSLYFGASVRNTTPSVGCSVDNIRIFSGSSPLKKDWPLAPVVGGATGVATHFNTKVNYAMAGNAAAMDQMRDAGFRIARYNMPWQDVERTLGVYNWTTNNPSYTPGYDSAQNAFVSRGLRPIICLAFQNTQYSTTTKLVTTTALQGFQNYCHAMALHYRNDNPIFEIWNEPNLASFGGYTPAEYIALVQYAKAGIIAGWREGRDTPDLKDPIIIGPAVANSWFPGNGFDAMLDLGLADMVDGLSFHPYNDSHADPAKRIPEFNLDTFKANLVTRGKSYMPLIFTEWGYSTGSLEFEITEAQHAKFVPRMILAGYYNGLAINCVYSLEDARNDNDHAIPAKHFGLFKTTGADYAKVMTAKPAVANATALYNALNGFACIQKVNMGEAGTLDSAKDWCLVFWNPATGAAKAAVWTIDTGVTKTSPNLQPLLNLSGAASTSFTDTPVYIDLPGYHP